MSPPSSASSSLYQVAQRFTPTPVSLSVSLMTLETVVNSLFDLLREQNIQTIVWAKLPPVLQCWAKIELYQEGGHLKRLYWCHTRQNPPHFSKSQLRSPIIPVVLEPSSQIKRDFFLLALSADFCSAIVAQEEATDKSEGQTFNPIDIPYLKLIYSFEPALIQGILESVKQWITITDTTPEELLIDPALPFELPPSAPADILSHLLLKQIQETESSLTNSTAFNQVQNTLRELSNLVNFKGQLLKDLSQELSVPLTNIKTALKLLDSMQSKREQRQRYIELLQRECQRQNVILLGLQEFVQLDQNTPAEINTSLKLEDLIPGIVSTYQPLAEEKGIVLGYTVPAGFPAVNCPEVWLRQIVLNLLSNSLKFTPARGRVFVEAQLKNDLVEIKVKDTGIGIDKQDLPHIFDSFYRGKNTLPDSVAGAGLGLTVVQQLVQRCGASLKVDSHRGRGTIFTLNFPVYRPLYPLIHDF